MFLEKHKGDSRSSRFFKLFNSVLDKEECTNVFVSRLWKAVIECQIGWAYHRFLEENPHLLDTFCGDKYMLNVFEVSHMNQQRRVCLLLSRVFSSQHVFKLALELQLNIPPSIYRITGTCNLHKQNQVVEFYQLLHAGLCKFPEEIFWYRVKKASKDAGVLSDLLDYINHNGFQNLVRSSEEGLDEKKPAGGGPLDPANPL